MSELIFKEVITKSDKTTYFWLKSYIYIFIVTLLAAPLNHIQSATGPVFVVVATVFLVVTAMEIYKHKKLIGIIKKAEKITLEEKLKKYLKKLRFLLIISLILDLIPFFWALTVLLKVYFYYLLNSLKIYLGIKSPEDYSVQW